jgi:NAD(P)-dependent dehydrogenase (short-subunit alcohol dehydrogenase family)
MRYVSEDFLTQPTRFWETPAETWRLVIETNVVGPFLMARAAVPSMLAHRWGRIVNISMNTETMRRRGFSPYGPSKAALESATAIWAQDLADSGITVNALLPGGATLTGSRDHGSAASLDCQYPIRWRYRPTFCRHQLAR